MSLLLRLSSVLTVTWGGQWGLVSKGTLHQKVCKACLLKEQLYLFVAGELEAERQAVADVF